MNITDIISLEGVVVRRIPMTSTSTYAYREGDEGRLRSDQEIVVVNGRKWVRQVKENTLGGLYLLTFKKDQFAQVHFNTKYDGIGDTVEAAYADYLEKHG